MFLHWDQARPRGVNNGQFHQRLDAPAMKKIPGKTAAQTLVNGAPPAPSGRRCGGRGT